MQALLGARKRCLRLHRTPSKPSHTYTRAPHPYRSQFILLITRLPVQHGSNPEKALTQALCRRGLGGGGVGADRTRHRTSRGNHPGELHSSAELTRVDFVPANRRPICFKTKNNVSNILFLIFFGNYKLVKLVKIYLGQQQNDSVVYRLDVLKDENLNEKYRYKSC